MEEKTIRFFDMFSGVGGFREGLNRAGGFTCVGHCEIDKYAEKSYRALFNTEGEWYSDDARKMQPEDMPRFDLLCGGFPCQAFSLAGKRGGFADPRGTLFFEIARVVRGKRPDYLLLENVPGLLSHNKGETFHTILCTLSDLGYHLEWQVLNSKDFGVPQSRKRVYIIGYLDGRCAGKILPVTGTNKASLIQVLPGSQGDRVYSPEGVSCTLTSEAGGMGGKTGLYDVGVPIKENTKKGYAIAYAGDSIDLAYAEQNTRRGRVGRQIAHTLTTQSSQGTVHFENLDSSVLEEKGARAVYYPEKKSVRNNGRRMKEPEEPMFTLTTKDRHGVCYRGRIRRLTPRECFRLQGYYDDQIDKILSDLSDTQAYKQAGNGVTVNVIEAIGRRLYAAHLSLHRGSSAESCEGEVCKKST